MEHFLETWGYVAVFSLAFISVLGIPVGAEVAIIYGGVLASGQIVGEPHHLNVVTVALVHSSRGPRLVGWVFGGLPGREASG